MTYAVKETEHVALFCIDYSRHVVALLVYVMVSFVFMDMVLVVLDVTSNISP